MSDVTKRQKLIHRIAYTNRWEVLIAASRMAVAASLLQNRHYAYRSLTIHKQF